MIVGVTGTGTTLNGSVAGYKYRPNIKITYSPAASVNGALSLITSPTSICPSATDVAVDFSNAGLDTITSAIINWSVNGVLETPDTFVSSLPQGSSTNLTLSSYTFSARTSYDLVCFISGVNGVADPFTSNDTLKKLGFFTGLSGNYTINSGASTSGTNFASFTAFAQALNALKNIEEALLHASVLLILASPRSIAKPWINIEAGAAWLRSLQSRTDTTSSPTYIMPLCHSGLTPGALPLPWNTFNAVELRTPGGLQQILDTVARFLKPEPMKAASLK